MKSNALGRLAARFVVLILSGIATGNPTSDILPIPQSISIGDKTYAVVETDSVPDSVPRPLPRPFAFEDGRPIDFLEESLRYWLGGVTFLRTPDGRFAMPFDGSAPFVGYIDLRRKEFVYFKDAFPPTGEKVGEGSPPRYAWKAVLDQGPAPRGYWLLVTRWNREEKKLSGWRARISFDFPDRIEVTALDDAPTGILGRRDGELLCNAADDTETWTRLSLVTWRVVAKGKPTKDHGHLGYAAYSPDKREIWACYSKGLVVFDAQTGEEKLAIDDGAFANARSFGAMFDPSGEVAIVSTPYQGTVAVVDVKTHRVRARYKSEHALAGIVFDGKELKAFAIKTMLPYE